MTMTPYLHSIYKLYLKYKKKNSTCSNFVCSIKNKYLTSVGVYILFISCCFGNNETYKKKTILRNNNAQLLAFALP